MICKEKFSERLKSLREQAGINTVELAEILKQSKQSVSNFENGKNMPSIYTLDSLADYFDVSTDYLLGRVDEK